MNQSLEQKIIQKLDRHNNDPFAMSMLAIHYLNNHVDNFKTLHPITQKKIYAAFIRNVDSYFQRKTEWVAKQNSTSPTQQDISVTNFANAYQKMISRFNFSDGFKNKLWTSMSDTLSHHTKDAQWTQRPLDNKMVYADNFSFKFMKHFDPRRAMHSNATYTQHNLVALETGVLTDPEGELSVAWHNEDYNKILFNRTVICYNSDWDIDMDASHHLAQTFDHSKNTFDKDTTLSTTDKHSQFDLDAPHVHWITHLGNHKDSCAHLIHELTHLCVHRARLMYLHSPKDAKQNFSFTTNDYTVATANKVAYVQPDDNLEAYYSNKEEVLAYLMQHKANKLLTRLSP